MVFETTCILLAMSIISIFAWLFYVQRLNIKKIELQKGNKYRAVMSKVENKFNMINKG